MSDKSSEFIVERNSSVGITRKEQSGESRRVQHLRVQGREWSVSLVNVKINWVLIKTETYRVIEDEITRKLHSDLK
jgi:hypothetical protein